MRPLGILSILFFVCLFSQALLFRTHLAQSNPVTNVCAANYRSDSVSLDSIVAAFGVQLATTTAVATPPDPSKPRVELPTMLGGTTVRVAGILAPLFFVSPTQVNYVIPPGLQLSQLDSNGLATVEVTAGNGVVSVGRMRINRIAPAIFSFDSSGAGLPAAVIIRVKSDGNQIIEPIGEHSAGVVRANPVDLSRTDERIFLTMFVSGIRNATDPNRDGNVNENIRVLLNGYEIVPSYAGGEKTGALSSIDNGRTWRVDPDSFFNTSIAGRTIYAYEKYGGLIHAGTDLTLYRKGGSDGLGPIKGWLIRPFTNESPPVLALTHTFERAVLGTEGRGVFLGSLSGQNWSPSNQGLPANAQVSQLTGTGHYVFAVLANGGLYRSDDHGATWSAITDGLPANRSVTALESYGRNVFAGVAGSGVFLSNDFGQSWRAANDGLSNLNVQAILASESELLIGTSNGVFSTASLDLPPRLPLAAAQNVSTDEDSAKAISLGRTDQQFSVRDFPRSIRAAFDGLQTRRATMN